MNETDTDHSPSADHNANIVPNTVENHESTAPRRHNDDDDLITIPNSDEQEITDFPNFDFLEDERNHTVTYGWIFIFSHSILFCIYCASWLYLIFHAPRTHGWNSSGKLYGIDIVKDKSHCRQYESLEPTTSCFNSSNSTNGSSTSTQISQCPNIVKFGSGTSQRIFYSIFCFFSIVSLIWCIIRPDKFNLSIFTELYLGVSAVGAVIILPITAIRTTIELTALQGYMALDWNPPHAISDLWLHTQQTGNCCGVHSFDHWKVPISTNNFYSYSYPLSCCDPSKANCSGSISSCDVWKKGCFEIEHNRVVIFTTILNVFLLSQIIFSIYGICLISRLRDRRIYIRSSRVVPTRGIPRPQPRLQTRSNEGSTHNATNLTIPHQEDVRDIGEADAIGDFRVGPNLSKGDSEFHRTSSEHEDMASGQEKHPESLQRKPRPNHQPRPTVEISQTIIEAPPRSSGDISLPSNNHF